MIRFAAIVTLLFILGGARPGWASTDDARAALEEAILAVDRAASLAEPQRGAELASLADRLRHESSVGAGAWLAEPLERAQPDAQLTRTRLHSALDVLVLPSESGASDMRRQALQSVIHGPPFETRELKSYAPEWLVPLVLALEWLARTITDVIRWPFDRLGELFQTFLNGPAFLPIVSLVALAAVASLVLLYRGGLRAALVHEAALASPALALPPTCAEAVDRAHRLAADAQYRDACHFMFLSALVWIEEHGQTRFERSATNWEHLDRLDRRSPFVRPLHRLVHRFDRVWYGQSEISARDYHDLETLALGVREATA